VQIAELSLPVTAAKADWLIATQWIGFTPSNHSGEARERCRSVINAQVAGGYVIEYITRNFGNPNEGYARDERYLAERDAHSKVSGRFVAVHRLRPSARRLSTIVGEAEFERLQNMWATDGKRYRWSVAFPIVESYAIANPPLASQILRPEAMRRLFAHPSATLRPLNDAERAQIAHLTLVPRPTANAWIGMLDEIAAAERSEIEPRIQKCIDQDLARCAMEGLSATQRVQVRRRAAWLAQKFIRERVRANTLFCDDCGFDPAMIVGSIRQRR
jgi:5-methylcytosine-specific restriction protein A